MKETLNEKIERLALEKLAALPRGKNAKLQDVVNHVLHVAKVKDVPQTQVYDIVSRTLGRLKNEAKVRYVSGRGCGWRLP